MKTTCVICSDLFDELNPVTCTPCGHVFHEVCALQWIEHSRTCPQCRQQCTERKLKRLYLNYQSEDENIPTDTVLNELSTARADLKLKDMEIRKLQEDMSSLKCITMKAEDEASQNLQKFYQAKSEATALKLQMKDTMKELKVLNDLNAENKRLKEQQLHFKNIQSILKGSQEEIDQLLVSCGNGPQSQKHMATYLSLLKKELSSCKDAKQTLTNEAKQLRKEVGFQKMSLASRDGTIESLKFDLQSIRERLEQLETERNSLKPDKVKQEKSFTSTFQSPGNENVPTPPVKRPRINMVHSLVSRMKDRELNMIEAATNNFFRKESEDEDHGSTVRQGFDGMGGHSRHIIRSNPIQIKMSKKTKKTSPDQQNKLKTITLN